MPFLFEKLDVYRRAIDLADTLSARSSRFPRGQKVIADQLSRAAVSVVANIAEGNGRFAPADRCHFFAIARGSAFECVPLLELALRRGLITAEDRATYYAELDEICKMLNGLMRAIPHRPGRD